MRRPSIPRLRRPSRRALLGAVVVLALLAPGWLWLRESSLVRVNEVSVTGLSGPQSAQVRQALVDAAERMSTLNVDVKALEDAVRRYPVVAGLRVEARPLHKLDIEVRQHVPVGALANGTARMAVAGDGTVLHGTLTKDLPLVPVSSPPGGRSLAEPRALRMVALLGAAPTALLARINRVEQDEHGLVAHVTDGPELYFGAPSRLESKWAAATRVLADYSSRGATYVDIRVPERPAAGGLEEVAAAEAPLETQPELEASGQVTPPA